MFTLKTLFSIHILVITIYLLLIHRKTDVTLFKHILRVYAFQVYINKLTAISNLVHVGLIFKVSHVNISNLVSKP